MEVIIPKLEESVHDLNWYGGLLEMKVCDSVMFQYVPIGHGSPHVPKSHLKFLAIQLFISQDCWSSPYSGWSLWIPIWCLVLGCSFPHNDGWLVAWTPLKNMSSSVGMIIPNIWKHNKCSKPPTRWCPYETNTHTHCWPRILSTRSQPAKFPIWVETDLWRPIRPTKSQWTNASTGCQFQTFSLEKVPFDAYWRDWPHSTSSTPKKSERHSSKPCWYSSNTIISCWLNPYSWWISPMVQAETAREPGVPGFDQLQPTSSITSKVGSSSSSCTSGCQELLALMEPMSFLGAGCGAWIARFVMDSLAENRPCGMLM